MVEPLKEGAGADGRWVLVDGVVPSLFEICAKMIVQDPRLVAQLYYHTPLRLGDLWHVVKDCRRKEEEFTKSKWTLNATGSRDSTGRLGHSIWRRVDRCERLVSLILDDCSGLTDALLRGICGTKGKPVLEHLERISVCSCPNISDVSLEVVIRWYNSRLKMVQMSNSGATQRSVKALARWCPNLEVVAFSHQLQIRDKHVIQLAMMCPNLKQIDASYCRLLTDASVMAVAEKLWALETLDVSYCEQIGTSVEGLQRCRFLQGLRLQNCPKVTDRILKPVLQYCTLLEVLCVRNCPLVTMQTVHTIAVHCVSLRSLDIAGFQGNGNNALAVLAKSAELRSSLKEFCSTQRVVLKMTSYLWQLFGYKGD